MSRFLDADTADRRITTVDEYLAVFPDPDPLGLAHLDGDDFLYRLARLSMFALEPASVVGGLSGGLPPAPNPQSGPALSSRGRTAGTHQNEAAA